MKTFGSCCIVLECCMKVTSTMTWRFPVLLSSLVTISEIIGRQWSSWTGSRSLLLIGSFPECPRWQKSTKGSWSYGNYWYTCKMKKRENNGLGKASNMRCTGEGFFGRHPHVNFTSLVLRVGVRRSWLPCLLTFGRIGLYISIFLLIVSTLRLVAHVFWFLFYFFIFLRVCQ